MVEKTAVNHRWPRNNIASLRCGVAWHHRPRRAAPAGVRPWRAPSELPVGLCPPNLSGREPTVEPRPASQPFGLYYYSYSVSPSCPSSPLPTPQPCPIPLSIFSTCHSFVTAIQSLELEQRLLGSSDPSRQSTQASLSLSCASSRRAPRTRPQTSSPRPRSGGLPLRHASVPLRANQLQPDDSPRSDSSGATDHGVVSRIESCLTTNRGQTWHLARAA